MESDIYIPDSLRSAGLQLRLALSVPVQDLPAPLFARAWSSIAYLFPHLHPDHFDAPGSSWPRVLKPFAAEAWHRSLRGLLADEQLYPSDAQWCGLYDRMPVHSPDETRHRLSLADQGGLPPKAISRRTL